MAGADDSGGRRTFLFVVVILAVVVGILDDRLVLGKREACKGDGGDGLPAGRRRLIGQRSPRDT